MIKTRVGKIEIACAGGVVSCSDPSARVMLSLLCDEYADGYHGYQPDPNGHKLKWIAVALGFPDAQITGDVDHPELDPLAEY